MKYQEKTINWYISIIVPFVHKWLSSSQLMLEEENCEEIQINYLKYIYFYLLNLKIKIITNNICLFTDYQHSYNAGLRQKKLNIIPTILHCRIDHNTFEFLFNTKRYLDLDLNQKKHQPLSSAPRFSVSNTIHIYVPQCLIQLGLHCCDTE